MTRLTTVTFLALITTAQAEPLPYPKGREQGASGYVQSAFGFVQIACLIVLFR
jgi:hypothetical protein